MILSRYTIKNIDQAKVSLPDEALFELPEKVLQFGTNVRLRGLVDYFIDKANRQGIFNGRIIAVRLNPQGDTTAYDKQDGLFTHCIRDFKNGKEIREDVINASISRVLNSTDHWNEVLDCAHIRDLQIIVSYSTENGLQLIPEDIRQQPPKSYPGKLLAFLYERFHAFGGSARSGMIIIPTELIPDNGRKLESIVLELAHLNGLEEDFIEWLENHNCFCNSLTDRIVPCQMDAEFLSSVKNDLGYTDNLLVMSEDYALWAIEADEQVKGSLSFAAADERVIIEPDIKQHFELKLQLLNGIHSLSCAVAFLSGYETVKEAMEDKTIFSFVNELMQEEISSALPYEIDPANAQNFASIVLTRFRNPYIKHPWLTIAVDYSIKIKMRCIPVLIKHYQRTDEVPQAIALGIAAYIYFMKAVVKKDSKYFGEFNGESYWIQDELAEVFYKRWAGLSVASLVQVTLSDGFWGADLLSLPGFKQSVIEKLNLIINNGMKEAIENVPSKNIKAA